MATAYLYGRVSTQRQKDEPTREDQENALLEFYKEGFAPSGYDNGGYFFDSAQSGGKPFAERKQGKQLYHSILQQGDVLLAYDLSRITRDIDDWIPMKNDLLNRGVVLWLVHDTFKQIASDAVRKYTTNNYVSAITLVRELQSEERINRNVEKRGRGENVTFVAAMGWKIKKGMTKPRVDHRERQIIEHLASLRQEGMTLNQIARYMQRPATINKLNWHKPHRNFQDARYVQWGIRAAACDYPQYYTGFRMFNKAWRNGELNVERYSLLST
jgi:DNA invertase Pin-like site-specific DNA recombinase